MPSTRQLYGAYGEELAARWYEARGYEVIARNWRCREGELDLVAKKARLVVFCEVKARARQIHGTPAEAVTPARQRRLRRSASRFLSSWEAVTVRAGGDLAGDHPAGGNLVEHRRPSVVRFDVAEVRGTQVSVIEAAF